MQRNLQTLSERSFDLVIVGGGIYGACLCWEAISRGLSAALLDKGDFGAATSANMHRILHGGFRYLRNLDVKRIRESVRERNAMMRFAPHLTEPLPFLVPTAKSGVERRELMLAGLLLYEALSVGRNRGIHERARRIPHGRLVSAQECLRLAPGLDPRGVTGGAIWYDGALRDPSRLCLELVRSAAQAGAAIANHLEVTTLLRSGSRVVGVQAHDRLGGNRLDVRGSAVVIAAGPWTEPLLAQLGVAPKRTRTPYVRSVDVVTPALTLDGHGLALMGPAPGAPERQIRYFVAPWRGHSVVGSVDYLQDVDPDDFRVEAHELEHLIAAVCRAMPGCGLKPDDILCVQAGLIPHDGSKPLDDPYNAARHYRIADHGRRDGAEGLYSVMGIKYTTARDIAQKTIRRIARRQGKVAGPSRSAQLPLHGTPLGPVESLLRAARESAPPGFPAAAAERLARTYGSGHGELFALLREDPRGAEPLAPRSPVLRVEVAHAVRNELALTLTDVVRRTELGALEHPGAEALRACAGAMAPLLGWAGPRIEQELAEAEAHLARFWARRRPTASAAQ